MQYKLIAYVIAAFSLIGLGYGICAVRKAKQIAELETANRGFEAQQKILIEKANKTEAERNEAEKIAGQIADNKKDAIIRINNVPIGPGCEAALKFLRDETALAQARRDHK